MKQNNQLHIKMQSVINDLNDRVCEREELIHCIALALLTRKNLFILGDTGQAKSYAITEFCKRISGTRQFEKLMSKQADESELFGRLDLASIIPGNVSRDILLKNSSYKGMLEQLADVTTEFGANVQNSDAGNDMVRITGEIEVYRKALAELYGSKPTMITAGKIPNSEIVFLDEIFKANEGILNSLLTALNERKWTNEGHIMNLPVISFFSASNEIPNFTNPEEKILKPLYDRFELKVLTNYVEDRDKRLLMLKSKQGAKRNSANAEFTMAELQEMQKEVSQISVSSEINEIMDDILIELRKKGVHVSDRKYFNFAPIVQAEAWLCGENEVKRHHLLSLKNYLWNGTSEIPVAAEVLERFCVNPIAERLNLILCDAAYSLDDLKATDNKKAGIVKLRSEFVRLYSEIVSLQNDASQDETGQIEKMLIKVEDLSKEAHALAGCTYAPLQELKILSGGK